MTVGSLGRTALVAAFAALQTLLPAPAAAQWFMDGAIGGNHSLDADVSVRIPASNLALDFHDVRFAAESNRGRRYYVLRLGRLGSSRRIGWDVELIHLKAVADTSRSYDVTVLPGSDAPSAGVAPMDRIVQRYQMTHGVNLALVNLVLRQPVGAPGGRLALAFRAGGGATFPHAETIINGVDVHQYEFGGFGAQGAVGLHVRLVPHVGALAEYKLTYARPTIDVLDGGTGWTSLVSHHALVGVSIQLTR